MPRAYWKGYLRLSLVTCPVELFPASSLAAQTHFHVINKKTGNRVHEQMIDEGTGEVVTKDEKGRGYELSKGRYVEIDEDELAKSRKGKSIFGVLISQCNQSFQGLHSLLFG